MHKAILKISVQVRHAVIYAFTHKHPTQVLCVLDSWLIHVKWAHKEPGAETGECAAARRSCCLVTVLQHPTHSVLAPGPLTLLRARPAPLHVPGHSQWWPAYGPPAAGQTQHIQTPWACQLWVRGCWGGDCIHRSLEDLVYKKDDPLSCGPERSYSPSGVPMERRPKTQNS